MSPRQHPTGLAALASAGLVLLAVRCGVEVSAEEAAIIVGLVGGIVSKFSPRVPDRGEG